VLLFQEALQLLESLQYGFFTTSIMLRLTSIILCGSPPKYILFYGSAFILYVNGIFIPYIVEHIIIVWNVDFIPRFTTSRTTLSSGSLSARLPREYKNSLDAQCALYNPGGTSAEYQQGYPVPASTACPGKPYSDARAGLVSVTF
jgi:hypothetical protein